MNKFMELAFDEAIKGLKKNKGGPFGAVVVRNNKVIAKAHNEVTSSKDPTAHAEMNAIRKASKKLNKFDLSDCVLYTSCEPCPMCLSAILWSRIKKVYYHYSNKDAAKIGFDDRAIYKFIQHKKNNLKLNEIKLKSINKKDPFKLWEEKEDKIKY